MHCLCQRRANLRVKPESWLPAGLCLHASALVQQVSPATAVALCLPNWLELRLVMELSSSELFVRLTMGMACLCTVCIWCGVRQVSFCFEQAVHAHIDNHAHQCALPVGGVA